MKILIGSPIHQNQEKGMDEWLRNVAQLDYPADLLLVDSSPGKEYIEKVRDYCHNHAIKNFRIEHLEIGHQQGWDEKVNRSRELIRQQVLAHNYDAWFSWECDQLLPADTLDKLVRMLREKNLLMISHNPQAEEIYSCEPDDNFSVSLITKEGLKRYGFLLEYPDMPNSWYGGGTWFKKRILRDGGKYTEVNINHSHLLNQPSDRMKLNLGCGRKHRAGYINVDIQEPCDLKLDLTRPLPFADNCVAEIFSENFFWHISGKEWQGLKREMARVLSPGGKLDSIFLDFEYILRAFLDNSDGGRWNWWWLKIFSAQTDQYDFAKNGFTYEKMVSDLEAEGLADFSTQPSPDPSYIHLTCFKKHL